jgi:hypothetical protein
MSHRFWVIASAAAAAVFVVGCANSSSPSSPSSAPTSAAVSDVALQVGSGGPDYEQAYYNGTIVTMNHIEVQQNPNVLEHAAADLYAVIYPGDQTLWPSLPLCNPCVHNGNPIYHDHVLDSIPGDPGHGEFNPLWHVFVIRPANGLLATQKAYAARLPMRSEAEVDAAIDAGVAIEVDTHSYFLCSIVNEHAAR